MIPRPLVFFAILSVTGCATGNSVVVLRPAAVLAGPREVVLRGKHTEVEAALEDSLRGRGFHVKRFTTAAEVTETAGAGRLSTFDSTSTRYVVETDWTLIDRCFDGGFRFEYLRVDLTDAKQNEVVFSTKAKGYSEKCKPLSGHIFGDIASQLSALWGAKD